MHSKFHLSANSTFLRLALSLGVVVALFLFVFYEGPRASATDFEDKTQIIDLGSKSNIALANNEDDIMESVDMGQGVEAVAKVPLEFFVMSRCPDAVFCERHYDEIVTELSPILNVTVSYIGNPVGEKDFQCPHGEPECMGDRQQVCAQRIFPFEQAWRFIRCQSDSMTSIPDNMQSCAQETGISASKIEACVSSDQGIKWMQESFIRTKKLGVQRSCTIFLQGKQFCVRDGGRWYDCETYEPEEISKRICDAYQGSDKPQRCYQ